MEQGCKRLRDIGFKSGRDSKKTMKVHLCLYQR